VYNEIADDIISVVCGDVEFANNDWLHKMMDEGLSRAVLKLLAKGNSMEDVAEMLDINVADVLVIELEEAMKFPFIQL
jgi:hypothetical protein